MTGAVEPVTSAETLASVPTSAQIRATLDAIRGDLAAGYLHVGGKSYHGFDSVELAIEVTDRLDPLPRPLSQAVMNDYALHVGIAIRRDRGRTSPLSALCCLPVTWPIGATRSLPVRPDAGAIETARARLAAVGLTAAVTIIGGKPEAGDAFTLTSLLSLTQPIDLAEAGAERAVLDRLQRLASKLEAEVPADLATLTVPCPGAIVRVSGARQRAACLHLNPSARTSIADLDRILDGTSTSTTKRTKR